MSGTIRQQRARAMLQQLASDGASHRTIAERIGVSQPFVSGIIKGARDCGEDTLAALKVAYGVHEDYFSEPDIGARAWQDFVGRSPLRLDRDDAKGTPAVESFLAELAAAGSPAPEDAARHLRGLRHSSGDVSRDAVQSEYLSWRARQVGKALPDRPSIAKPIDEARGQRKLEPVKKKRPN